MAQFGDFTVDRNSTKYVLGSGGTIISYATDEPAFEFNADGSYKGLLVEPAATNLCLQSEDINTTWTPFQSTPTQSTEETPDGDTSSKYIKLVDDGGGGTGIVAVYQSIAVSAGTKYTASAFLKADGLDWAVLNARDYDGTTDGYQFFDLSTGSLGTASNLDDSSIEAYPNGWYFCSITWTQGAGDTSFTFRVDVAGVNSDATVDRDGTSSIFVWGAQVETGSIATSYIPTTTASVTRVKDDITLGSASSLIGQTEGTIYVEVDWRETSGVLQYLLSANDDSVNNRIAIRKTTGDSLNMLAVANNVTLTDQGESSSSYSGAQKLAFAYANNDFALYRNGSPISFDTSGSLAALATLTNIDLGQAFNTSAQANMWIRAVSLYPKRLSAAQLAALTGSAPRLIDSYSGAAAAYSLRNLSTSTTNVVKVRRSGDDAELDFTASEVSGGTLAAWVVAGGGTEDGFVVTWYDQSGNGNNATQATAASQPTIVSSGTLVTENGKAAVLFDGTDDGLNANGFNQGLNDFATFAIINISEADDWCAVANGTSRANEGGFMIFGESANRYRAVFWTNTASQTAATSSVTKAGQVLQSIIGDRDNLLSQYLNGTFGSSTDISSYSNVDLVNNGDLTIGYGFSFLNRYCNTPIQEIIIYNSDQSANRTGIEANINDYYNIYP